MGALCTLVLQEPHDPQGDPQGGHQDVLQVSQVHFQVDQPEQFQVAACRSSPGTSCALPRLQRAAVRTQGVGWRVWGLLLLMALLILSVLVFSFVVFHDKAKRTQQGKLLEIMVFLTNFIFFGKTR